jgi:hypothetical protein
MSTLQDYPFTLGFKIGLDEHEQVWTLNDVFSQDLPDDVFDHLLSSIQPANTEEWHFVKGGYLANRLEDSLEVVVDREIGYRMRSEELQGDYFSDILWPRLLALIKRVASFDGAAYNALKLWGTAQLQFLRDYDDELTTGEYYETIVDLRNILKELMYGADESKKSVDESSWIVRSGFTLVVGAKKFVVGQRSMLAAPYTASLTTAVPVIRHIPTAFRKTW